MIMSKGWKDISQIRKGDSVYMESRTRRVDQNTFKPFSPNGIVTRIDRDNGDVTIIITFNDAKVMGVNAQDFEGRWNDLRGRWDLD